jgi:hypothetical protein
VAVCNALVDIKFLTIVGSLSIDNMWFADATQRVLPITMQILNNTFALHHLECEGIIFDNIASFSALCMLEMLTLTNQPQGSPTTLEFPYLHTIHLVGCSPNHWFSKWAIPALRRTIFESLPSHLNFLFGGTGYGFIAAHGSHLISLHIPRWKWVDICIVLQSCPSLQDLALHIEAVKGNLPLNHCYDQMIRLFQNLSHDYFT